MSWSLQTSKRNQLCFFKSLMGEVEEGIEGKMVMDKIKYKPKKSLLK